MTYPKYGEIWLVCFDPSVGTEIKKTRPALIVSNNIANEYGNRVTLLPITSNISKNYPFLIDLKSNEQNNLSKDSKIMVNNITTFDKIRLIKKLGEVDPKTLSLVSDGLRVQLNL